MPNIVTVKLGRASSNIGSRSGPPCTCIVVKVGVVMVFGSGNHRLTYRHS